MRRGECIFDLDPNLKEQLEIGIEMDGSNLSGVNCRVDWSEASDLHNHKCTKTGTNCNTNTCTKHWECDKENHIDDSWPSITDYRE